MSNPTQKRRSRAAGRRSNKLRGGATVHKPTFRSNDSIGASIKILFHAEQAEPLECPFWPPDLFAVAGSILRRTGAYRLVFETPAPFPRNGGRRPRSRPDFGVAATIGEKWREAMEGKVREFSGPSFFLIEAIPPEVQEWWRIFSIAFDRPLGEFTGTHAVAVVKEHRSALGQSLTPVEAALCLVIAADSSCYGVGVTHHASSRSDYPDDLFLWMAHGVLFNDDNDLRSVCLGIRPDRVVVLPKQHTPQTGLTFRSLSHHLALCPAGEVQAKWRGPLPFQRKEPHLFNFLLLPWPLKVDARDFHGFRVQDGESGSGAFAYAPRQRQSPKRLADWVTRSIKKAAERGGDIDIIVLPEASLSLPEYTEVERVAINHGCMLIAGVRLDPHESSADAPTNVCAVQIRGLFNRKEGSWALRERTRFVQPKQHRWKLDRRQILQYGLGSCLPAGLRLWENIALPSRRLDFISLGPWMTWCALVCEDLARQEPIAEIVRAIGPNLVIALLMDGPQLKDRWSARYASILADDPGTSVLSMTNLGLVLRSKPIEKDHVAPTSPVIALWRDAIHGYQEIAIQPEDTACVLSLVCHTEEEFTVDGRSDGRTAHHPVYAGHHSFQVKL